ncbi:fatty acid desaturase [Catovirus CTV1]|mgnify:CR=1 FL=1|uniref:Fatty acid desaturase n=1 Tax=Catovirus CTV1 TaxID=1977631 RepID=A0A1V0SAL5_9VIRU|nr:fatty acid desaturase [Catovirus CTV1]
MELSEKGKVYNHISKYASPSWVKSFWNLLSTSILLYICFTSTNYWLLPLFSLTLMRTFIIFHDIGHESFFPDKKFNYFVGLIVGTIVVTPFSNWTFGHNHHHKHSNKLDRKQYSQTAPWDVERYKKESFWNRLIYKFAYGKYTLFTVVPWLYFIIVQHTTAFWYENLIHICYLTMLYLYCDFYTFAYILIAYWIAALCGFILFHAQHTFDGVYKEKEKEWDYFKNGMYGSSYVQIPWYLKYFTCGIEYHHIHHLNTLVPSYNLKRCHDESGELFKDVKKIYITDILKSLHYSLYNVTAKCFEDVYFH